jgi:hypothetical protein
MLLDARHDARRHARRSPAPACRLLTPLAAAAALLLPMAAQAAPGCASVLSRLGIRLADATCFVSNDLTTANAATTPANNAIAALPAGAFTPLTDRTVIAPSAAGKTPIVRAVPGLQIEARIADDPTGEARLLLRLPADWNGRLVVAGHRARAVSSTAISPGATTSCRRDTPMRRRTRAC